MSKSSVPESLRQFFGGYFHEDWTLEAKDWQTSVDNYMIGEAASDLMKLAQQIDALGASYGEDELEEVMYRDALCSFYPAPITYHEWLRQVSNRLRSQATTISDGDVQK